MVLHADEARRLRSDRGNVNHQTYKDINEKICNRIRTAAAKGETTISYKIPPMIPGRPPYDIVHAIRYNHGKLVHAGYRVRIVDDTLHVDWRPEPKKKKKKPPAPKPPPPKTAPKPPPPPGPKKGDSSSAFSTLNDKLHALGKKLGKQW
jgi:hypothetical protein